MKKNGKIILFGNGGSAADAQHIAAEFMGKFKNKKRFLQAIALTTNSSTLSAIGNDFGFNSPHINIQFAQIFGQRQCCCKLCKFGRLDCKTSYFEP